ncbi:MAG: hypothetical protein AAF467_02500 [Actinomycetota bacterium]
MVFQPTTETGSGSEHGKTKSEWRAGQRIVLSLFLLSLIAICLYYAYESRELSEGDQVATENPTTTAAATAEQNGATGEAEGEDDEVAGASATTTSVLVATSSPLREGPSSTDATPASTEAPARVAPEVTAAETTLTVADQHSEAGPTTSIGLPARSEDVVTLHTDREFAGRSWALRPGRYTDEIYASPLGGKPVLSVELVDGLSVRLCDKAAGDGVCITIDATTRSLAGAAVIEPLAFIEVSEG